MLFSSWGRWLRQYTRLAGRLPLPRGTRRPRRPYSRKPLLEVLEDRTLLSIQLTPYTWTAIGPAPIVNGQIPGVNPVSGRVTGLATDPSNPDVVYAATAGGGVWKTTDATAASPIWTPLTDHVIDSNGNPVPLFMGSVALAPSNPSVIYAGTGEANNSLDSYYGEGILKSTDGGQSWTLLDPGSVFNRRSISKIVVDPRNPNTVYAAVASAGDNGLPGDTGIWKSTDGGASWVNTTAAQQPPLTSTDSWSDLVIDPTTSGNTAVLFAAVGNSDGSASNGVYESTNGGAVWTLAPVGSGMPSGTALGRISLAIAHPTGAASATLYASIAAPSSGRLLHLERSTNGGATWTDVMNNLHGDDYLNPQGWYDNVVAINPTNPNEVFVAGVLHNQGPTFSGGGIVESQDGGQTWTDGTTHPDINTGTNGNNGPHTDYHALAFDADGRVVVGNDGGVWRLDSNDLTTPNIAWTDLNGNLDITQFQGAYLDPANADIVYGGSQDNGTEEFNGALGWTRIAPGDGGPSRVDPTNINGSGKPPTVYQEYAGGNYFYRSDDGGNTFTDISNGLTGNGNFYAAYALDPTQPGRVLYGSDALFESTNYGNSWTQIGTVGTAGFNPNGYGIDFIAAAPSDPKTLYVSSSYYGTSAAIFVTHNDGTTWSRVTLPAQLSVAGIAVDPTDANYAYAVIAGFTGNNGHVYETTDGGTTWTNVSGNLPDVPTYSVLIDPRSGDKTDRTVYVGTDTGVYFTQNAKPGATWQTYGRGLPNAQVVSLDLNTTLEGGQGILLAATHGRGAWEIIPQLVQGGYTFAATEGSDPGAQTVAGFFSGSGSSGYTATIDWGDGSGTTAGTINSRPDPVTGLYDVTGDHVYAAEGSYTIKVTIQPPASSAVTAQSTATVSDPAVQIAAVSIPTQEEGTASGTLTLATFTDPGGAEGLSDYSATINWGDKTTPTTGTITYSNGTFTVSGGHTYAEEGNYTVTVTVTHDTAPAASATGNVAVADPPVVLTPASALSATEGATLRSQVVATFTDPGGAEALGDYSATIDWGDGSGAAPGVILYTGQPGDPAGVFTVEGTHKYTEEGAFTVTATVTHDASSPQSVTTTAAVADVQVVARGLTFNAPEGMAPGNVTVAIFTDPGGPEFDSGAYSATIDWGDGSTTAGTISYNAATGVFSVLGSHAYGAEGSSYPVTVTLTHDQLPAVTVYSIARVTDVPVSVTGIATLTAVEGEDSGPEVVATFTDPAGAEGLSDYSATINWGDGSPVDTGSKVTIAGPDGNGVFSVSGDHTYTEEGTYTPTVTVHHDTAADASASSTVTVADQQIILTAGPGVTLPEGGSGAPQVLATFTDPGGAETTADYSATINWGDNTAPTPGTIAGPDAHGTFSILGTHAYGEEGGSYTLTITATHATESAPPVTESATVTDVPVSAMGGYVVAAVEGADSGPQVLATFTDPGGPEFDSGAYSATINWGDGSTTAGTILGPDSHNVFTVEGRHTYQEEDQAGQAYTVSVAISHDATQPQVVASSAVVSDPAVLMTAGGAVSAVEGQSFTPQLLATFTDPGGAETTADYSATINWGDGQTSSGVVSPDATLGVFDVYGSNSYTVEGSFTATVTVQHDAAAAAAATDAVTVSDPAVVGQGGFVFSDNRGLPSGSQVVATFTDPGGAEPTGDYTATIAWGDGTSSTGTVSLGGPPGSLPGTFSVLGSHVYATPGPQLITVTLGHDRAPSVPVSSMAVVSEAAVAATGGQIFSAIENINPGNEVVATFTDPAGAVALGSYSATINWGDGTSSPGIITYSGPLGSTTAMFSVLGSHVYQNGSSPPISVTIHHAYAPDVTVSSSSSVTPVLSLVRVFATPLQKMHTAGGRSRWTQTVLVLNTSPFPLSGHFVLVLAGLGVAVRHGKLHSTGAHLMGPAGFVRGPLGTLAPYVAASFSAAALNTPPGGVFFLQFTAPAGVPVQFTPILEEGTNVP